jgi:hypothetical protein
LREKVSAKLTDEGSTQRLPVGFNGTERRRRDPSSVACGDTFSRKGRRTFIVAAALRGTP